MHTITAKNVHEAEDAIRDILLMYVEMASSYHGFGHAVDIAIRFNPLRFIDAEVEPGNSYFVDVDLLRTGSAIVIVCRLYDCWCEHEGIYSTQADIYKRAVEEGRLHFNPDIEKSYSKHCQKSNSRWRTPGLRIWLNRSTGSTYGASSHASQPSTADGLIC